MNPIPAGSQIRDPICAGNLDGEDPISAGNLDGGESHIYRKLRCGDPISAGNLYGGYVISAGNLDGENPIPTGSQM